MKKYDVIVIGAGSAGLSNSGVARTMGLKTLLIEKDEDNFGGDCTNYGCVPSKAIIHIAHQFHAASVATRFGLQAQGKADMGKVLNYIHEKQAIIKKDEDARALRKKGIDVVIGNAQFHDHQTIRVHDEYYQAKIILLCTGSSPRKLTIKGMEHLPIYTNETIFFDCKELPDHFIIIGGGPIGCELGQAFSRLGSQVTIINRGDRLLAKEPENVSRILEAQFEKEGIFILNQSTVESFESHQAVVKSQNNASAQSLPCDAVLLAVGRTVNTAGMALDKGGVELTGKGKIKVNDFLQTTNSRVYAVGDAAGTYMFSHGSEKMTRMLWRNLLIPVFMKKDTMNDLSWVTFTDPQVAHFGLTEEQLKERGIGFYRQDQSLEVDDRAIIQEYTYGNESIWMEDSSNISSRKILSGSLIAPNAGEIIQEMELAKHAGISIGKITQRVYPYPVQSRINQKTIRGVMEKTFTDFKLKLARIAFRLFH